MVLVFLRKHLKRGFMETKHAIFLLYLPAKLRMNDRNSDWTSFPNKFITSTAPINLHALNHRKKIDS